MQSVALPFILSRFTYRVLCTFISGVLSVFCSAECPFAAKKRLSPYHFLMLLSLPCSPLHTVILRIFPHAVLVSIAPGLLRAILVSIAPGLLRAVLVSIAPDLLRADSRASKYLYSSTSSYFPKSQKPQPSLFSGFFRLSKVFRASVYSQVHRSF